MVASAENDEIWIKGLKENDYKAFEYIYNKYKRRLFLFALKFVKSEELAEEVLHDVFLKIWELRASLDEKQCFSSYLFTICKNHILNLLKKIARENRIKHEIGLKQDVVHQEVENGFVYDEYKKLAEVAIAKLPAKRRLVFTMVKVEGMSYEEVVNTLHISRNAVKDHVVKAGKAIKEYLLLTTGTAM
jgi:RNA polymerase sigma-70 factor (family 1)